MRVYAGHLDNVHMPSPKSDTASFVTNHAPGVVFRHILKLLSYSDTVLQQNVMGS